MNNVFKVFASGLLLTALTGCYKDRSSIQTTPTPKISVEVKELGKSIHIDAEDVLSIEPVVSVPQGANIKYKWELSKTPGDYEKEMEVISTEQALKGYKITRQADATTPYYLRYTVTNASFGDIETVLLWKLYVSPVLADGLLFAYTKDGSKSDLGYIKSPEFTRDYTGKSVLITDLLAKQSGKAWDGLIKAINFSAKGSVLFSHTPYAWAVTADHKLLRFDPLNYSLDASSDRNDLLLLEEEAPKILQFSHCASYIFMRTEKKAYLCKSDVLNFFSEPINGWEAEAVSGDVLSAHGSLSDRAGLVWYNGEQGTFKATNGNSVTTFKKSQHFDPNNIQGAEAITAVTTIVGSRREPGKSYFLLKDKASGVYTVYRFELALSHDLQADEKYTLSEECAALLNRRTSAAFSTHHPVLYVSTDDGINAITWSGDGSATVNKSAFLSLSKFGKVKSLRLYRQGEWAVQPHRAFFTLSKYNEAALIAITEGTDGNDQVHFIPVAEDNTAALGVLAPESEIRTFSPQSGKIMDIVPLGK